MKKIILLLALLACAIGSKASYAQSYSYTGRTAEDDTLTYTFPPPDSAFVHNRIIVKFYDGGLNKDSLCYDCGLIIEPTAGRKGALPEDADSDGFFATCKETLLAQRFTLGIITDPIVRSVLMANGASYIMRMTAANPCVDTLSITRRGDTIRMDHYNWVEVFFNNDTSVVKTIEQLAIIRPASIQFADLDIILKPDDRTPCDLEYIDSRQKDMNLIGMPKAWGLDVGEEWVKVAVIDNGVDYRRCEFGGDGMACCIGAGNKVSGGWDYNPGGNMFSVDVIAGGSNHGTNCASIIGAFTSNLSPRCMPFPPAYQAWGMAGIAGGWQTACDTYDGGTGVQILAYRIDPTTDPGQYDFGWAASAILDAVGFSTQGHYGYGAHVISNSYGIDVTYPTPAFRAAIGESYREGASFVASKGNVYSNGDLTPHYPADFSPQKDVTAVGGSNYQEIREDYSNWGRTTDLIAPGGSCGWPHVNDPSQPDEFVTAEEYSADAFMWFCGTSAACPHVSGVIALLRGYYPYYSNVEPYPEDWEGMLEATAGDIHGNPDPLSITYSTGYESHLLTGWGFLKADTVLMMLDPTGPFQYVLLHDVIPNGNCTPGSWSKTKTPMVLEDDGFNGSLKAGQYMVLTREWTGTTNYESDFSNSINRAFPVFVWGNGGGVGWSAATAPNSQEPWCEVTSGHGGISGTPAMVREGIQHGYSSSVTCHAFQYDVYDQTGMTEIGIYPPTAYMEISFSIFASSAPVDAVAMNKSSNGGISILPSIADRQATVLMSPSDHACSIEVVNVIGDVVIRQTAPPLDAGVTLNTSDIPNGIYFCCVSSDDGTEISKFVVNH